LKRIESSAFSNSSLESIEIPRNVQFIDGSTFLKSNLKSISIETGHERFLIDRESFVDIIDHRLIRHFGSSSHVDICCDIEILGSFCFSDCKSLSSISFESNSRLKRIESSALRDLHFQIVIPSTILFIASDAVLDPFQIDISDCDSCPEFSRWQELRASGVVVDFRRLRKVGSGLLSLPNYQFDLSELDEGSIMNENDRISTRMYHRRNDDFSIVVKSLFVPLSVNTCHIEREIEKLVNLQHPCIAAPIGFIHPSQCGALKIIRLYAGNGSLSDVISVSPEWWTPTAKAKAVAGLVLGLRFGHSLGLLHGHLTASNIVFNEDKVIQITDFCVNRLAERDWNNSNNVDSGGFSEEYWTPMADIRAFSEILSMIAIGASDEHRERGSDVPKFVSEIIERKMFEGIRIGESMVNIFNTLHQNGFKIVDGVDSDEVSAFVNWVESSERETE
jgi:hypothetical protein